jgi:hypothetical protein
MASNSRFLLLDQHPNLHLFDRDLTVVTQCPWKYDRITDMCWSSTLNSFIMITNNDGVFIFNESLSSLEPIQMIQKEKWLSCTCSAAYLFLTTNKLGSDVFQFSLLSSFNLVKQWSAPQSCNNNELIHNIAYNNETLVLLLKDYTNNTLHVDLRSSTTFDRLWSLPLGITNTGPSETCTVGNGRIGKISGEIQRPYKNTGSFLRFRLLSRQFRC